MNIVNLEAIAKVASRNGIFFLSVNTVSFDILRPIDHGVDIVGQSLLVDTAPALAVSLYYPSALSISTTLSPT